MKVILLTAKAQSGKDTVASIAKEILESEGKRVAVIHLADLLKHWCRDHFGWTGEKDERGRTLLQYVGTDVVRKQCPDFWTARVADFCSFFKDRFDAILVPDVRFPNEVSVIKDRGLDVVTVRITRPGYDNGLTPSQKSHPSETAMDGFLCDYDIINDSTLDELKENVRIVLEVEKLI